MGRNYGIKQSTNTRRNQNGFWNCRRSGSRLFATLPQRELRLHLLTTNGFPLSRAFSAVFSAFLVCSLCRTSLPGTFLRLLLSVSFRDLRQPAHTRLASSFPISLTTAKMTTATASNTQKKGSFAAVLFYYHKIKFGGANGAAV